MSSRGKISGPLRCCKQICWVHKSTRLIFFVRGCHVYTTKKSLNFLSMQHTPNMMYSICYIISRFQSQMVNAHLHSRRFTRGFGEFGQTQLQSSSLPPQNNLSFCLSKRTHRQKYKDVGNSAALWLYSWYTEYWSQYAHLQNFLYSPQNTTVKKNIPFVDTTFVTRKLIFIMYFFFHTEFKLVIKITLSSTVSL